MGGSQIFLESCGAIQFDRTDIVGLEFAVAATAPVIFLSFDRASRMRILKSIDAGMRLARLADHALLQVHRTYAARHWQAIRAERLTLGVTWRVDRLGLLQHRERRYELRFSRRGQIEGLAQQCSGWAKVGLDNFAQR